MEERPISPEWSAEDAALDSLRPRFLDDYIGQPTLKDNLRVFIQAARERNEPLDHVLLHGPPGLGKTSLSMIIANELGVHIRISSGPALEKQGDLVALLTNLEPGDVLFLDEIHRLSKSLEEVLYSAMEDAVVDLTLGKGPSARSVRLDLSPFTLIGATTRAGLLSAPLRDRFGVIARLDYYSEAELAVIIHRTATILRCAVDPDAAAEIARRSRGTPRIANRLLKRVRDFAQVSGTAVISFAVTEAALARLNVDKLGLDDLDVRMLTVLLQKFQGGPVGLDTLAAAIGEDAGTIEEVCEPYLLQMGLIQRTPRGRVATVGAYAHFGVSAPTSYGLSLE